MGSQFPAQGWNPGPCSESTRRILLTRPLGNSLALLIFKFFWGCWLCIVIRWKASRQWGHLKWVLRFSLSHASVWVHEGLCPLTDWLLAAATRLCWHLEADKHSHMLTLHELMVWVWGWKGNDHITEATSQIMGFNEPRKLNYPLKCTFWFTLWLDGSRCYHQIFWENYTQNWVQNTMILLVRSRVWRNYYVNCLMHRCTPNRVPAHKVCDRSGGPWKWRTITTWSTKWEVE